MVGDQGEGGPHGEALDPMGVAAMKGVASRGVLSMGTGPAAREERRASTAGDDTADAARRRSLKEEPPLQKSGSRPSSAHSRPGSAHSRPTSAGAARHLAAVNPGRFKFAGSGFKMPNPKDQPSTHMVDALVHTFQRASSIPLVHNPKDSGGLEGGGDEEVLGGTGVDIALGTLQTRRLSGAVGSHF